MLRHLLILKEVIVDFEIGGSGAAVVGGLGGASLGSGVTGMLFHVS
jgi:hypothetical protein